MVYIPKLKNLTTHPIEREKRGTYGLMQKAVSKILRLKNSDPSHCFHQSKKLHIIHPKMTLL